MIYIDTALLLGIVIGLTEVVKKILSRYIQKVDDFAPLIRVLIGLSISFYVYYFNVYRENDPVLLGILIGLSASGLLDLGKMTVRDGIIGRIKQR